MGHRFGITRNGARTGHRTTTITGNGSLHNESVMATGNGRTIVEVPLINDGYISLYTGTLDVRDSFVNGEDALLRMGVTSRTLGTVKMAHGFENFGTMPEQTGSS